MSEHASYFCTTSAQLLHARSAADVSPAYAASPSLVPYTNRPFGHQRMRTKRLTIVSLEVAVAEWVGGARRQRYQVATGRFVRRHQTATCGLATGN